MRHSKKQEGSALMFALLAIVFLTVIGLSLAMVTETEMLIGTNEQIAHETFVTAESGIAVAFNNVLINNNVRKNWFAIEALAGEETRVIGDNKLGYVIDYTDLYPAYQGCPPYGNCTDDGEKKHYAYFFIGKTRARRLAWPETDAVPDCQRESERTVGDPQPLDYFESIQSEKTVTMGFYAAPLPELTGLDLADSFRHADVFGCAPDKKASDYEQDKS
jgi:hypothetical protein